MEKLEILTQLNLMEEKEMSTWIKTIILIIIHILKDKISTEINIPKIREFRL